MLPMPVGLLPDHSLSIQHSHDLFTGYLRARAVRPLPSRKGWSWANRKCRATAWTHRMDEGGRCVAIGKGAQISKTLLKLFSRWWSMDDLSIQVSHHHVFVTVAPPTGCIHRVKGVKSDAAVHAQLQFRRQGCVL